MVDKIKPLKLETIASGSMHDNVPKEADPTEDYTAVKGIAFENQDTTLIDLDGSDNIQFTDPNTGTRTLADLYNTYGTEYTYATSNALSVTSSTTFQQKIRLNTPNLPNGNYLIVWSFEWATNVSTTTAEFRIQGNDVSTISLLNPASTGQNYIVYTGFISYTGLGGTNFIDLDYRRSSAAGFVGIQNARIAIWRVD